MTLSGCSTSSYNTNVVLTPHGVNANININGYGTILKLSHD